MPVITSYKSRLPSQAKAVGSQFESKLPKIQRTFKTTRAATIQNESGSQDPSNKPSQDSLLNSTVETSWLCQKCSCHKGLSENSANSCVQCGYTMDDHAPIQEKPWDPECKYLCKREELVTLSLQCVRLHGTMIIRASPQAGKTTLLRLLGHRIAHQELDLEPVYLSWKSTDKRNGLRYQEYLAKEQAHWRTENAKIRPYNPAAQKIYLIDEAQDSYKDQDFWSMVKNFWHHMERPLYVLVFAHGATGISEPDLNILPRALQMHSLPSIELRPTVSGMPGMLFRKEIPGMLFRKEIPGMLFRKEEVAFIIQSFATSNHYQLEDGVDDYFYDVTDGHPGMVGLLLSYLEKTFSGSDMKRTRALSPKLFHDLIVKNTNGCIEWLTRFGKGVWSAYSEACVEDCLEHSAYSDSLKLLDIKHALMEVVRQPDGLSHIQGGFDAFAFCHKMGFLHTETRVSESGARTFTFASPLHRRLAYYHLISHRERDAVENNLSLHEICANAIARFLRKPQSNGSWGIPRAALQDELSRCLKLELRYLPILSEHSSTKEGRIDLYVSDKKWGIELLQCESTTEIEKHTARFATGGEYRDWDSMDDFIVLNFCSISALRNIEIQNVKIKDEKVRSRFFHVVVEPGVFAGEIYAQDEQGVKKLSRKERQKANTRIQAATGVEQEEALIRKEKEEIEIMDEERKRMGEERKGKGKEVKRKGEEIKEKERDMERMQQEETDRQEIAPEEDKPLPKTGKKRKR